MTEKGCTTETQTDDLSTSVSHFAGGTIVLAHMLRSGGTPGQNPTILDAIVKHR